MSNCRVVESLIGLVDRYELFICDPCSADLHQDCKGKNATHVIGGETITGKCQCTHGLIPKARKGNEDGSEQLGNNR